METVKYFHNHILKSENTLSEYSEFCIEKSFFFHTSELIRTEISNFPKIFLLWPGQILWKILLLKGSILSKRFIEQILKLRTNVFYYLLFNQ